MSKYQQWLCKIAPAVKWLEVHETGCWYDGEVFAVCVYEGRILLHHDFLSSHIDPPEYGPYDTFEELLQASELYDTSLPAIAFMQQAWNPANRDELDEAAFGRLMLAAWTAERPAAALQAT